MDIYGKHISTPSEEWRIADIEQLAKLLQRLVHHPELARQSFPYNLEISSQRFEKS
jgi:hypothetical protein